MTSYDRMFGPPYNHTTFSNKTFLVVSRVLLEDGADTVREGRGQQVNDATECAFAICVQEYELSVNNGVANHFVVSTRQPFSGIQPQSPFSSYKT